MSAITPGICRYCKCSAEHPCWAHREGEGWYDAERTVCSSPPCIRAAKAAERAAEKAARKIERISQRKYGDRFAGWGKGAIVEELRREERARKRRKGRAA